MPGASMTTFPLYYSHCPFQSGLWSIKKGGTRSLVGAVVNQKGCPGRTEQRIAAVVERAKMSLMTAMVA